MKEKGFRLMYVRNSMKEKGFRCPKCKSADVEFDRLDSWNDPLEDWMDCHECGKKDRAKEFLKADRHEEDE